MYQVVSYRQRDNILKLIFMIRPFLFRQSMVNPSIQWVHPSLSSSLGGWFHLSRSVNEDVVDNREK